MKLAALGDLFLGDQLACLGFGVRSYCDSNGYDHLFEGLRAKLKTYDIVVANLETVLSQADDSERHSLHRVLNRGCPKAAGAIKNGGIQLLTLANNHIFDYGSQGLDDTVAALEGAGLSHCGTFHKSVHVQQHDGRSYAFLSWSLVPDPGEAHKFYNVASDPAPIFAELRKTRPNAHRTILSLHAGNEFVGQPSEEFQRLCHDLVDAGADIILGHHPHVLQPIERHNHGLIAYSLGNFVFCSWSLGCRTGIVLGSSVDEAQWTESSFFEMDKRTYAPALIGDRARVDELTQHVSSPRPLTAEVYLQLVQRLRNRYRVATVWHVLKNLYRAKWRLELFRIAIDRFRYLWSIRKIEGDRPNLVYMGQSYLQRSRVAPPPE